MTENEVMQYIKEQEIQLIDVKFCDLLGTWQHFTVPISELSEDVFKEGFGFDGSSIRGWQAIEASDMLIIPDASTAVIDNFIEAKTLSLTCNIKDPITGNFYDRDPRYIAQKAEKYLKSTGIADTAYFGPEAEFFIFDDIRYDQTSNSGYYYIDSEEGIWNSGRDEMPNLGHKPRYKEGYFPVSPIDTQTDIRNEMVMELQNVGIRIEAAHHEVATGGQAEIDMRFNSLTAMGDSFMWYKYIIKNVARRYDKTATFMPKPLFGDNGSGMHVHQSLWKNGQPLFAGKEYAGLSEMGLYYIGGILKHAKALCAFTNSTTNSYKRLVPGFEAPVNFVYSSRNRSAAVRIPMYSNSPKAKRIEYRTPDPTSNCYIAFSALLLAGLDGIQNKIHPGKPVDKDLFTLSKKELKNIPVAPGSLEEALKELEKDHKFLLQGGVFTEDVIRTWIDRKMENDVQPVRMRPVPYEFALYYDI
ncbi:MAG: type I glutamate--ammonia ligase [Deltaproteobacteria bacterium]|jgi:glutamine synthetase|nr:type I glutamate--ammonia ligase [Deltaproteobacteria bacterium]MCL5879612.1 type I glutamate--ammonia ligase [Deltaproteobacteria bacterium]MDA8305033.1 type I glutamate--ammonia ligase [Deltaproteobacteria bacterium]